VLSLSSSETGKEANRVFVTLRRGVDERTERIFRDGWTNGEKSVWLVSRCKGGGGHRSSKKTEIG
jgi:hypothetical protein